MLVTATLWPGDHHYDSSLRWHQDASSARVALGPHWMHDAAIACILLNRVAWRTVSPRLRLGHPIAPLLTFQVGFSMSDDIVSWHSEGIRFPPPIPPELKSEVDMRMLRFDRELAPLLKRWQGIAAGAMTVSDLESEVSWWCDQQISTSRETYMSWVLDNNPETDASRVIVEREIRTVGQWYAEQALAFFDDRLDFVVGTMSEKACARQWIEDSAKEKSLRWLRTFRDWCKSPNLRADAAPHQGAGSDGSSITWESMVVGAGLGGDTISSDLKKYPAQPKDPRKRAQTDRQVTSRLQIDETAKVVRWGQVRIKINHHSEYVVLSLLVRADGGIVAYGHLLRAIKPGAIDEGRTVTEAPAEVKGAVSDIRPGLEAADCPFDIKAVRGQGYRLRSTHE